MRAQQGSHAHVWLISTGLLLAPNLVVAQRTESQPPMLVVDCSMGQSLGQALELASKGSTIKLRGVCQEQVTISTDEIELDGEGSAIIQGDGIGPSPTQFDPLLTIEGARGVALKGLTVQDGSGEGILAQNGASFRLENITVQNNGNKGIAVFSNSTAELAGVTSKGNLFGFAGFNGAVAILHGTITLTDNLVHGLAFEGKSSVDLRAAQLNASNNGGFGIVIVGSELDVFDFGQGNHIIASHNGGCGLAIISGGLLLVLSPPPLFGSGINVFTVKDNGACGIFIPTNGSIESPLGAAKFIIENNPVGLSYGNNSGGVILGGLQVQNNGVGVLADGAGSITFGSFADNTSFISDNSTTDVDLRFGSRVTFCDMTVGAVLKDDTALTQTLSPCPSPSEVLGN